MKHICSLQGNLIVRQEAVCMLQQDKNISFCTEMGEET